MLSSQVNKCISENWVSLFLFCFVFFSENFESSIMLINKKVSAFFLILSLCALMTNCTLAHFQLGRELGLSSRTGPVNSVGKFQRQPYENQPHISGNAYNSQFKDGKVLNLVNKPTSIVLHLLSTLVVLLQFPWISAMSKTFKTTLS